MNIPEEAIAAFQEAWEAKRKEIGRGISPKGTKTRAGLEAALPYLEAALRTQIAADIRDEKAPHRPGTLRRVVLEQAASIAEEGAFHCCAHPKCPGGSICCCPDAEEGNTMTTNYTASNGITIHLEESEMPVFARPATGTPISPGERLQALREYFQHQRDQELGRWRDPETGFVVYRDKDYARTLSERTGDSASFLRRDFDYVHGTLANDPHARAARAYFAAHPELKPWRDARPGDVWLLNVKSRLERDLPALVNADGEFVTASTLYNLGDPDIVHAVRLWPEGDDDE